MVQNSSFAPVCKHIEVATNVKASSAKAKKAFQILSNLLSLSPDFNLTSYITIHPRMYRTSIHTLKYYQVILARISLGIGMTFFKGRHLSSGKAIKHHHNAQQTTENSLFVIKSLDRGREICLPRSTILHATSSINNCQMRGCNLVTQEHHHQGLTTLHCLMQVLGTTPRFCLPRSQQCTLYHAFIKKVKCCPCITFRRPSVRIGLRIVKMFSIRKKNYYTFYVLSFGYWPSLLFSNSIIWILA